ncbi:hypothetical protein ACJX0J_012842 [Zea mays]
MYGELHVLEEKFEFMYQGGIPHVMPILHSLWSSVIFQIFGAIFKMGDHEVRAQSNPIQTTWACCVKNKEKGGAELEVSVDPKETYEKGNCFTHNFMFWTEVFLWSSVIFQIFGAIFKMGDHFDLRVMYPTCGLYKLHGHVVFFFGTADHVLSIIVRSESNIPLGHLLVKEQELIMSSNLSKEYIKN